MRLPYSENAKKVLIEAENIASSYSNPSIGTEHILYGLTVNEQCTAGKLLRKYSVNAGYFERYFINNSAVKSSGPNRYCTVFWWIRPARLPPFSEILASIRTS